MSNSGELQFVALGGLGEIGMNACAYGFHVGKKRQWVMIDCGVSFANEEHPGVDLIMPDVSFLEKERKNIVGLIITHAHEDHFGALVDLWPRLGCPIYMTPFSADLLEARRLGEPGAPKLPVKRITQTSRFDLGSFNIEMLPVAHSIPEACAVVLRSPLGTLVHSGDWKLDPTPVVGLPTDEKRLAEIGEEGVLALISDSTNITRDGQSPSEREVAETLKKLIAEAPRRVAVTTFASNVARIRAVAEAAQACGREVVLMGRAMDRVVEVATELKMLEGLPPFREASAFKTLPANKVVALLTGSQGEPRAALARISTGQYRDVEFEKGDRIIFSSRTIPGNEKAVGRIVNELSRDNIEIITDRHALVHVSGHPRRSEMAKLYAMLKPQIAVPAHGEALHLTEHAAFAKAQGVPKVIRAFNGDVVQFAPGVAEVVAQVPAGRLFKDGNMLVPEASPALADRRKLAFAGVVSVALAIDEAGELASDPEVVLAGIPERDKTGQIISELVLDFIEDAFENLNKNKRKDSLAVKEVMERVIRAEFRKIWDKKPVCIVQVLEV